MNIPVRHSWDEQIREAVQRDHAVPVYGEEAWRKDAQVRTTWSKAIAGPISEL